MFEMCLQEPAEHRGVFGGVTATSFDSQRPVCPVDQVPVSRESIGDHILSGASSNPTVVVVATGNNLDKAEANCAQVLSVAPKTTHVVYSKEQVQPEVAMTEEGVTQERATRIMMHTGKDNLNWGLIRELVICQQILKG
jgi:hypothetical protein